MARLHGITADTWKRYIFDSGKLYKNFVSMSSPGTCIGATRGGSTFVIETEIRELPVDGARGPVRGGRRIVTSKASLKTTLLEISKDTLLMALPGARADGTTTLSPDHVAIRRAIEIDDGDYLTNVVLVASMAGSPDHPFGVGIENALCDQGLEMSFVDKEETTLAVTFTAHFNPADLDTEPWFLLYPEDLTTTTAP
jgi:hypothetical protein